MTTVKKLFCAEPPPIFVYILYQLARQFDDLKYSAYIVVARILSVSFTEILLPAPTNWQKPKQLITDTIEETGIHKE